MPYQKFNYASIPPHIINGPLHGIDFGDLLKKGMQLRHEPQRLLEERQQAELSNRLGQQKSQFNEAELPFASRNAQSASDIQSNTAKYAPEMSQAEIDKMRSLAAIGGMQFPGGMGLVQGEESARRMWGPNDPRTLRASKFNDLLAYVREMSGTPPSTKLRVDNQRIMNDPNIPEDQKREMIALNNAANVKGSVIPKLEVQRTRAEITAEGFNKLLEPKMLNALTTYSGYGGTKRRAADEWEKLWTGKTPERLLMHEEAESTAEGVAMNLRAAIEESVSPFKSKQILDMISPSSLKRSPEQAMRRLKAAAKFFEIEKREIDKATGRGGAHNETINALDENTRKINNKKTLKNQQEAARKSIPKNNEPKKEEPITISHIWKDGKWVSKK